ncbi:hypothetical protein [Streptomyces sp. JNUCC 63]
MAEDFTALAAGRTDPALLSRLRHRTALLPDRGACRHPDGAARLAASALHAFADESTTTSPTAPAPPPTSHPASPYHPHSPEDMTRPAPEACASTASPVPARGCAPNSSPN